VSTPVVFAAPESLDAITSGRVRPELHAAVERCDWVAVDLGATRFMDMTGLGLLVGTLRRARAHDCRLTVICDRELILRMFRLTGMDRVLDVRPSLPACTRCERPVLGTPVTSPGDQAGRLYCTKECRDTDAEAAQEQWYPSGVAT
jgi:anti-sigma B factor antagonist